MAISLGLVACWAFRHTNSVCKYERSLDVLKPKVRIVFIARVLAAEITLRVVRCHDGIRVSVLNCINAYVASTSNSSKEKDHTKEVCDSTIS